ncbi:hypothetical protein QBC34DRAFT_475906, partial [Podospora aff. communis PSN243]
METDDMKDFLSAITHRQNDSIISLLVDLQDEPNTIHRRPLNFIRNLECLLTPRYPRDETSSEPVKVRRDIIDATKHRRFVALSWTWSESRDENPKAGSYYVQQRYGNHFEQSKIRDCILDRVFHYTRSIDVDLLWIDSHCIVQDTSPCKDKACREHETCVQKRDGMAVMDLVYSKSEYPVGLLGRPIADERELKALAQILRGELTQCEGSRLPLASNVSSRKVKLAIDLLTRITNDKWWQRAWVFQENYKGGMKMKLLIRHSSNLERLKITLGGRRREDIFGDVEGELCIRSVDFFEQATRLCLACQKQPEIFQGIVTAQELVVMERAIESILHRAGRYQILLQPSEPMTPSIVADLYDKNATEPWDMLPIVANSCGYAVRLDSEKLKNKGANLDLAILAQCLLNGEILHNGRPYNHDAPNMTVPEYLKHVLFSEFEGPTVRSLTFNKSCRFIDPYLSEAGIHTEGHLWKLGKVIETENWPARGAWVDVLEGRLEVVQRKRLSYLAGCLEDEGHAELVNELRNFLDRDARLAQASEHEASFAEIYMLDMADEVADAIKRGQPLILGCLWNKGRRSPYRAIFPWDEGCEDVEGLFAFTASRPEDVSAEEMDLNDLDRHVSFQVSARTSNEDAPLEIPELRIKRWLPGLCFFRGIPRTEVVFPWPEDLASISP